MTAPGEWRAATTDEAYFEDLEGQWWTWLESIEEWYPSMQMDVDDYLDANPDVGVMVFAQFDGRNE